MAEHSSGAFRTSIGGQALIEGILMRGPEKQAIVVRDKDGQLVEKVEELKLIKDRYPILGIPLIRGTVNFLAAMVSGVKALMYSADFYPEEEESQPSKFEQWLEKHLSSEKLEKAIVGLAVLLGTVINEDEQVFFAGNYQERINSPIITTGNELMKQQIADFSKQLNLEELYLYIFEVWESTEKMLERLSYDELKRKIPKERKGYLESLNVVNDNEKAIWLIDYWCSKDIRGLIQMPFSRHWIMHTEACLRIKNKIHS